MTSKVAATVATEGSEQEEEEDAEAEAEEDATGEP